MSVRVGCQYNDEVQESGRRLTATTEGMPRFQVPRWRVARRLRARLLPDAPMALLTLAVVATVATIGVALFVQLRQVGIDEATGQAERQARLAGIGIVAPAITQAVLDGEPAALARLHRIVDTRVMLDEDVVRVKVWTRDGRIVFSDERRLIGERFALDDDDHEAFAVGGGGERAERPERPGEPLRAEGPQAAGGLPPDRGAHGRAAAVRVLQPLLLDHGERAASWP